MSDHEMRNKPRFSADPDAGAEAEAGAAPNAEAGAEADPEAGSFIAHLVGAWLSLLRERAGERLGSARA